MLLYQKGILSYEKYHKYVSSSDIDHTDDYLTTVLFKARKKDIHFNFLLCLYEEKEHTGHADLFEIILAKCDGTFCTLAVGDIRHAWLTLLYR